MLLRCLGLLLLSGDRILAKCAWFPKYLLAVTIVLIVLVCLLLVALIYRLGSRAVTKKIQGELEREQHLELVKKTRERMVGSTEKPADLKDSVV